MSDRPQLHPYHIPTQIKSGVCMITMSQGQWDVVLAEAYKHGWILLELDKNEKPIQAYRRPSDAELNAINN